jgi:hypothetical protein
MNRWTTRWLAHAVIGAAILGCPRLLAAAPPDAASEPAIGSASEREACAANLQTIYKAIEAYRADHKALPNWLSDLVPQYISDANVLVCPVCRRTGETEAPPLVDPKIPSSYLFEFCPVPLGAAAPNAPGRTRREWKRRQMGLVGSIVPLVRCRHHEPVLNLAFDGRVYDSPPMWEMLVTNRVSLADLSAAHLFANEPAPSAKPAAKAGPRRFPPRDPTAGKELLDLTGFYNAMLTESWHGRTDNDLAALPTGVQVLGGIQFDVRGIVQLGSKSDSVSKFPSQVLGIKVRQQCRHLYFLHAAGFGSAADEGKTIGTYVVHFGANNMRLEIPIVYGRDVRNWHTLPGEPAPGPELKVGWTGANPVSRKAGTSLRLFLTTWTNLAPEVEIESIDYVSSMGLAAPFLIAVTAD